MTVINTDKKIIIVTANGFDENHMTVIQRALTQAKLGYSVIAPEQGLVNGWQNNSWGHYFTVDVVINMALGSDYDALIIIGGERSVAKLKQNLHTKRIVNHFMEANKPVAAVGAGVSLLALSDKIAKRKVSVSDEFNGDLISADAVVVDDQQIRDGNMITSDGADTQAWIDEVVTLINSYESPMEEAA